MLKLTDEQEPELTRTVRAPPIRPRFEIYGMREIRRRKIRSDLLTLGAFMALGGLIWHTDRPVSRAGLSSALPRTVVLLALCVLALTGCTTETPQVASPAPSPRSGSIEEATHPHPEATLPGSTKEVPSIAQLKAWRSAVEEVASGTVRGITWTDVDERNRRVAFGLLPLRGAREQLEAAIARALVPREVIEIEVGCQGGALRRIDVGIPPSEELSRAIDHSLEVVSLAAYGETVSLKLTLKNSSDASVQFYTGSSPHDFVVATVHGQEVWHWRCGKTFQAILRGEEPGTR